MQLPESLSLRTARAVAAELELALSRCAPGSAVSIDAAALKELDSSALAVLIQAQRIARRQGLQLGLRHAPARLTQLAALYGLEELIGAGSAPSAPSPVSPPSV